MIVLTQKFESLKRRLKCLKFGIIYTKSEQFKIPSRFIVNGGYKKLDFEYQTSSAFIYEFNEICINDCYGLNYLKKNKKEIRVIVDIGANQGLFALAARKKFPRSKILCYEPNFELEAILKNNSKQLSAHVYFEAVTKNNCNILLSFGLTDLHTQTIEDTNGNVIGTSLREVIKRAGGKIDILKMDCEGGEWVLFEDKEAFQNVTCITMEYHLWARPKYNVETLVDTLQDLGYSIIKLNPVSQEYGLLMAQRYK